MYARKTEVAHFQGRPLARKAVWKVFGPVIHSERNQKHGILRNILFFLSESSEARSVPPRTCRAERSWSHLGKGGPDDQTRTFHQVDTSLYRPEFLTGPMQPDMTPSMKQAQKMSHLKMCPKVLFGARAFHRWRKTLSPQLTVFAAASDCLVSAPQIALSAGAFANSCLLHCMLSLGRVVMLTPKA